MKKLFHGDRKIIALLLLSICFLLPNLSAQMELDSTMVEVDSLGFPSRIKGQVIVKFKPEALNMSAVMNLNITEGDLSVFLKDKALDEITSTISVSFYRMERIFKRLSPETETSIARDGEPIPMPDFYCYFLLCYDDLTSPIHISEELSGLEQVIRFAEPNGLAIATFVPNDPEFTLQESLNPFALTPFPNGHVNAVSAWDLEKGRNFVKVGVYDTGVDWKHPDFGDGTFQGSVVKGGWDFTRDSSISQLNPDPAQFSVYGFQYKHGTRVAGIIGALGNNGVGIAGIAGGDIAAQQPGVQLFSMQMIRQYMHGEDIAVISMNHWAPAIVEGASWNPITGYGYGLHIMNHSWVTDFPYRSLEEAVGFAWVNQCLTVAARGNWYEDDEVFPSQQTPLYPACFRDEWVVNVGGSGTDGKIKPSGQGYIGDNADIEFEPMIGGAIDLIAPSTKLLVNTTSHAKFDSVTNLYQYGYDRFNGTSAAAPHVTGAAALLMSYFNVPAGNTFSKSLAPEDIEYILEHSAIQRNFNTDIHGYSNTDGWGLLQINQALQYIEKPQFDITHHQGIGYDSLELVSDSSYGLNLPTEGYSIYRIKKYKAYKTIAHNLPPGKQILNHWARYSRSLAYDYTDLNHIYPWIEFEAPPTQTSVEVYGYVYHVVYDHILFDPMNLWFPAPPTNLRFSYSLRVKNVPLAQGPSSQLSPKIDAYPNPANSQINFRYQILRPGNYQLQLIDPHGKIVLDRQLGRRTARFHTVEVDVSYLPAGIYALRIGNGTIFASKKISIIH